jgi:hypothetical protein
MNTETKSTPEPSKPEQTEISFCTEGEFKKIHKDGSQGNKSIKRLIETVPLFLK